MSVQDRLLVLLEQARRSDGDAALRDASALRSRLSGQAPDLHGEIQALAAALAMNAPARIATAADPAAERAAIATDIAQRERLSMSVVQAGLEVACLGGGGVDLAKRTEADSWAGDSAVVGADTPAPPVPLPPPAFPPHPHPAPPPYGGQPYPPQPNYGPGPHGPAGPRAAPFYTQIWFIALIAGLIIAGAVGYTLWSNYGRGTTAATTTPPVTPPPVTPATTGTPTDLRPGGPVLAASGATPTPLTRQTSNTGRYGIGFRVAADGGPIDGLLILPNGGWDGGDTNLIATNAAGAQSIASGRLQLLRSDNNVPVRLMQVNWQQDGVGAGATIVGFEGVAGRPEVDLVGSSFCILDGTSRAVIGCGRVQ